MRYPHKELIHSSCEDADLSFVATKSANGRIVCHLVNQRDTPVLLPLTVQGNTASFADSWSYTEGTSVTQVARMLLTEPVSCPARTAMTIELS